MNRILGGVVIRTRLIDRRLEQRSTCSTATPSTRTFAIQTCTSRPHLPPLAFVAVCGPPVLRPLIEPDALWT
eukprot:418510-Pyramimonas_sp.AAC.1